MPLKRAREDEQGQQMLSTRDNILPNGPHSGVLYVTRVFFVGLERTAAEHIMLGTLTIYMVHVQKQSYEMWVIPR